MVIVFVHGAGRSGAAAWPQQARQARPGWTFLSRIGVADGARQDAHRVIELLEGTGGGHVVAHSYGANAAVLAFRSRPDLVRGAALLEPACFDLARAQPAVEEHVAAMSPVFAVADDPAVSAVDFSVRFAAGMGTAPPQVPHAELEQRVRSLRALHPPWGLGLQASPVLGVPVLVITGGWSDVYEQTAQALVSLGAEHVILPGYGHRVQDHPEIQVALDSWWTGEGQTRHP